MFVHNISPVLFSLGPIGVRYYSLAYIIGAVITFFMIERLARERDMRLGRNDAIDFVTYSLLSGIAGARVFYVLFYSLSSYISNPLGIFKLWEGGLSFHGGLIGAVIFAYFFCRKRKINFWDLADITVIPFAVGLFLGRIGNFINGELYGRVTSLPWAVKFPSAEGFRHPSQLYEAAKNLIIFGVLYGIRKKSLPSGFIFWLFITLYGIMRFAIEFFRQPDASLIIGLSRGQFLCAIMVITGGMMLFRLSRKKHNV